MDKNIGYKSLIILVLTLFNRARIITYKIEGIVKRKGSDPFLNNIAYFCNIANLYRVADSLVSLVFRQK